MGSRIGKAFASIENTTDDLKSEIEILQNENSAFLDEIDILNEKVRDLQGEILELQNQIMIRDR